MNMFVQLNTINIKRVQLYSWPKYHQSGISMKTTHIFFILWPGFHWYFWWFQWYSRIFWQEKLKTLGGIHETWQKKLKPLRHPAGPSSLRSALRAPLRPPLRPSGPARRLRGFNLFFCQVSWIPPKVFNFSCQNIRENHWNHQKINEIQLTK